MTPHSVEAQMALYELVNRKMNEFLYRFHAWLVNRLLDAVVWLESDSNLLGFAKDELEARADDSDVNDSVLKVVAAFSAANHSGFSASYCSSLIRHLIAFKPISPIEDIEGHWNEIDNYGLKQHKRLSSLFKLNDLIWDIDKVCWEDEHGITYSKGGYQPEYAVELPYFPSVDSEVIKYEQ